MIKARFWQNALEELWVFQRFEESPPLGPLFLPYIVSIHRFLKRAQVYIRMVVHHWSAEIFNMIHSCKAFKMKQSSKPLKYPGTQTSQSHPQKTWCLTSYPLHPFTTMPGGVYLDAFCSVSSMDLKLMVTQALVDGGAASDMPAGMGLCFVFFLFSFSGLLRIWLR